MLSLLSSEHGMAIVNQTRPHCVNQMGETHSKPLAVRHGMGTACYVWIGLYRARMLTIALPRIRHWTLTSKHFIHYSLPKQYFLTTNFHIIFSSTPQTLTFLVVALKFAMHFSPLLCRLWATHRTLCSISLCQHFQGWQLSAR